MEAVTSVIVQYVNAERNHADYVVVSAVALLLYDYVLTLYQEIKLVWFTPWTHMKILFFLVRYIPFGVMYPLLSVQLFLDVPTEACRKMWPATAAIITAGINTGEGALMLRTWAVWQHNRYIGAVLAILWIALLINGSYFITVIIKSFVVNPKPYESFRGCFITAANSSSRVEYIILAVAEAVVMTLMMISAYRSYKHGSMGELSFVIHRDGIVHYFYLLVAAIINMILLFALQDTFEEFMALPLQMAIQSVLTTRVLLNIRQAAQTQPTYAGPENSTLVFAMRPQTMFEGVVVPSDGDNRFENNV